MSKLRAALQRTLLTTYKHVNQSGLLDTPLAERVFQRCYFAYKYLVEDSFARLTKARPELFAGGEIIDVGANIGYTAALFARAIQPPHRVHAFEPEERNFRWLEHAIEREKLGDRIVAHRAAVGSHDGMIDLWHNPAHHGDHRIARQGADGESTQRVPLVAIDTYVSGQGWPAVSFIKIDVQGFEPEVLAGLHETIARNPHLTVAVELMPSALAEMGFDPERFVHDLAIALPRLAILERDGSLQTTSVDAILGTVARSDVGYADLVCAR